MLKPYQIFHQVLFFLLVTFYATVQDTVGWKHSVYVRIPGISSTIINGYGSKIYFGRNLLGYGYQPSNKSEWAISAELFLSEWNRGFISPNIESHNKDFYYISKLPTSFYAVQLQFEKRWFLFRRRQFRPFGGISIPTVFLHEKNLNITKSDRTTGKPQSNELFNRNMISGGLGLVAGFRYQYKRWIGLTSVSISYYLPIYNQKVSKESTIRPYHEFNTFSTLQIGYAF